MRLIVTDVVPNLNPTFILGQDFLCDDDVNLQFTKNSMSLNIDPVRKVVAKQTVTIPPKSQAVLIGRIRGAPLPEDIEGTTCTSGSPNLFVALGLLPTKSLSKNSGHIRY